MYRICCMIACVLLPSCGRNGHEALSPISRSGLIKPPSFTVRAVNDSLSWVVYPTYQRFLATVRIVNRGTSPLFRQWCGASIQKLIDGVWIDVQKPICVGDQLEAPSIAPGDSTEELVRVYRYP